ncbi:DUF2007 domain-containing protein [bacterium]|nr:DUF2007 domain-containing protein [bacterium]
MFCPKCRAEFIDGITVCSDCEISLVKKLSPQPNPEYHKLVNVFSTWKIAEVRFVQSLLETNGINCFIKNTHFCSLLSVGIDPIPLKIMVEEKNKINAKEIVNQYYKDLKNK